MENEYKNFKLTGKAVERYFDFNKALAAFHALFNLKKKDERTIAILGGTFLEMALEHILYAFLPDNEKEVNKLFELNQPLANFSNKISMCYGLGLLDKVIKDDLTLIRKIRNKFAHDLYVSFDHEDIKDFTKQLKLHEIILMRKPPDIATELDIFQVGVNSLISHLSGCINISRGEKRHTKKVLGQFL